MPNIASELAQRLAQDAEAVCRRYLSNGRREGRYWLVGDVANSPGRSLYVRLRGPTAGRGAAGKWTDGATGEHGDLLDLIAASKDLNRFADVLSEARKFLALPNADECPRFQPLPRSPAGSVEAARRLFAASRPITGTLAERYLRSRGITSTLGLAALRFHPRCFYRGDTDEPSFQGAWPALIAQVSDLDGRLVGVHRTWLDRHGRGKAPVSTPRRAMGELLGHAVWLGPTQDRAARDVLAAGEGIETVLSLRAVLPSLPLAAALSAAHLAALVLPRDLRRLYLLQDNDAAGSRAVRAVAERAESTGVEALTLSPVLSDFNDDLRQLGAVQLAAGLRMQLAAEDVARFWRAPPSG